jgi:hypothetical protein
MTKDIEDSSIMTSRDSYAQSKCRVHCIMSDIMYIMYPHQKFRVLLYPCFRKINHLVPVTICIHSLMYVKSCREQLGKDFRCQSFSSGVLCILTSHIFWLKPLKSVFCVLKSKFPLNLKNYMYISNSMLNEGLWIDTALDPPLNLVGLYLLVSFDTIYIKLVFKYYLHCSRRAMYCSKC